jgi:hypothetical protein
MDIDQLAREADQAAVAISKGRAVPGTEASRGGLVKWVLSGFVLLLPLIVLQAHFSWFDQLCARVFPARVVAQGQADMKVVLVSARDAVEAAKSAQGALPDALPSAALAALVQYQRSGNSYRLTMSDGYSVATMEADGSLGFQLLSP